MIPPKIPDKIQTIKMTTDQPALEKRSATLKEPPTQGTTSE